MRAALIPVSLFVPPLILAAGATLGVAGVARWDTRSGRDAAPALRPAAPTEERA